MKNILTAIVLLLIFCANSFAQTDQSLDDALTVQSSILARPGNDQIELRWLVGKPAVWEMINEFGYSIERADNPTGNTDFSNLNFQPIQGSPFKPWTKEAFLEYLNTNDEEAPGVAEVYFSGVMLGLIDEEERVAVEATPALGDGLNSVMEGKNKLDNQFGFCMLMANQSADAARALGVRTTDTDIDPGSEYVYRINVTLESSIYKVAPAYAVVKAEPYNELQYTQQLFSREGDTEVIVKWNASKEFSTYNIDRWEASETSKVRITETPILNSNPAGYNGPEYLGKEDKGLTNYTVYNYRVTANTPFADEVLIGEIALMPRDRTPPAKPFLELPQNTSPEEVSLTWTMPAVDPDLQGFAIGRGPSIEGPFAKIHDGVLGADERTYADNGFSKGEQNYYVVQALDTAGNVSTSQVALVTLIDSIPPHQPVIASAEIDSAGVVRIKMEEQNTKDLMGFRIMKANAEYHEYSVIFESFGDSTILDPVAEIYTDSLSLKTLTKNAYYKVTALDHHYNESEPSVPVKVTRPDIIPPVNPLFAEYEAGEEVLTLNIHPSTSEDVVSMELWKKKPGERTFNLEAKLEPNQKIYEDKDVKAQEKYQYYLVAIDDSGLRSEQSATLTAKVFKYSFLEPVSNPTAAASRDKKEVALSWQYADTASDVWFLVYKKVNDRWSRLASLKNPAEKVFTEKLNKPVDSSAVYKIQVRSGQKVSVENEEIGLR